MRAFGHAAQKGVDDLVAVASSTGRPVRVGRFAVAAGIAGCHAPRLRRDDLERCEPAKRTAALIAAVCETLQRAYMRLGDSGSR